MQYSDDLDDRSFLPVENDMAADAMGSQVGGNGVPRGADTRAIPETPEHLLDPGEVLPFLSRSPLALGMLTDPHGVESRGIGNAEFPKTRQRTRPVRRPNSIP